MILTADSGSTKCDWMINTENESYIAKSMGFNPFFHDTEFIFNELSQNEELVKIKDQVDEVYFYGAGCSSPERNQKVQMALDRFFQNANHVQVDHDLTASAIATCGNDPGIACILGTGSNSCYFDGTKTYDEVPALGYILGDEGSGAYFGKIILRDFLYNKLPKEIEEKLVSDFGASKEDIFDRVYNKPHANVFLASFMPVVSSNMDHPYFKEMVYDGLARFAHIHIWCYDNYKDVPVHFIGSIAYYFEDILRDVARNHRFEVGKILKKPIDSLNAYHLEKSKER
jgi:glucosamine kinase